MKPLSDNLREALRFGPRKPGVPSQREVYEALKARSLELQGMQKLDSPERINTGALQIGDDWPGLFIRGDDCLRLAHAIETVVAAGDAAGREQCVEHIARFAALIRRDVVSVPKS